MELIVSVVISVISATGILGIASRAIIARLQNHEHRQEALELGVQALLRDRMLHNYHKYTQQSYAPIYAKENFENMYKQYHELGANGVMDRLYEEFMELPTERKEFE